MDKPFEVGDWVTVAERYGKVTDITMRSTRIRTNRNAYAIIPNKTIIDTGLADLSQGSPRSNPGGRQPGADARFDCVVWGHPVAAVLSQDRRVAPDLAFHAVRAR